MIVSDEGILSVEAKGQRVFEYKFFSEGALTMTEPASPDSTSNRRFEHITMAWEQGWYLQDFQKLSLVATQTTAAEGDEKGTSKAINCSISLVNGSLCSKKEVGRGGFGRWGGGGGDGRAETEEIMMEKAMKTRDDAMRKDDYATCWPACITTWKKYRERTLLTEEKWGKHEVHTSPSSLKMASCVYTQISPRKTISGVYLGGGRGGEGLEDQIFMEIVFMCIEMQYVAGRLPLQGVLSVNIDKYFV
eukprot:jgi/Bigna1/77443/fgenesh1_pg.48_\